MRGRWATILLIGVAAPALAQTATGTPENQPAVAQPAAQGNGQRSYDAAYFARFSPATALQIVERVPGFTLEQVDTAVRGFAGTAGNVVINGQRPSSKADTIDTILQRIPATRVLRVEVAPGDRFGADYASKPQVLNLILTAAGGLAGTVEAGVRRDFLGRVQPSGSASALLKRGRSTFNASATLIQQRTSEEGYDRVRALPSGAELEYRRKVNHLRQPNAALAGGWTFDGGTNRTAHLNGQAAFDRVRLDQDNHVVPTGGLPRDDLATQRYAVDAYELGGDITRPLAGGGLKLVGLATRRHRLNRDGQFVRAPGSTATVGGFTQQLDDRRAETLARLTWSSGAGNRNGLMGWNVELGAEGVLNRLESQVDLFQLGAGGAATRIDLPIDDAVVEERRGEAFVNAGRPLNKQLRLDVTLAYEASRLTVSGDATAERTLQFLKPKATLDWRPGGGWHATLAVARTVAQLQFEDFNSGAEIANDRINGGNADLLPQRAWELLATAEHPLLGDGLVRVEAGYQLISLVQDRVPTADGFDAPGNLGDGRVLLLRGNAEIPLGRLGIPGGRLTIEGTYYRSSVLDPYTLTSRPFSFVNDLQGSIAFRQDRKHFAWGWTVRGRTEATIYRLDETDRNTADFPAVSAFGEWRPRASTTVALRVDNIADVAGGRRLRTFYRPNRANRTASLVEERVRYLHLVPFLSVRQSLG